MKNIDSQFYSSGEVNGEHMTFEIWKIDNRFQYSFQWGDCHLSMMVDTYQEAEALLGNAREMLKRSNE